MTTLHHIHCSILLAGCIALSQLLNAAQAETPIAVNQQTLEQRIHQQINGQRAK